ncbi:MAG: hypothetical protein PUB51_03265 [Oscillospiraceae bacterium]|nr:hypothetical protein [Oscillospiraceae bacterium]
MAAKKADAKKVSSYEAGGRIQARVSDFAHGLRVFDGVKLIRIVSKDYTLLIMEDYFPCLGSIYGHVELVKEEDLVDLGNVKGFYIHRNNEFSLLIEKQLDEEPAAGGREHEQ